MNVMKERGKWAAALALCISCFVLCATLLSAPTLAADPPAAKFKAVTDYKFVYERLNAEGASKSPKEFLYASNADPDQVYNILLKEDAGAYLLGIAGYTAAPETRFFPVKKNATLDTKAPVPEEEEEEEEAEDLPVLKAIAGRANLYEYCDKDGKSLDPKVYVYANSAKADEELFLAAHKLGDKYYLRLAGDIYVAVAADGTLNCNDVISAGADKKLGTADDVVLFPKPLPVYKYKAVEGQKNLYEMLGADGKSKDPKEFIYSATAPEDDKAPPAKSVPAFAKGSTYYVEILEGSGIFLAVNSEGALSYTNAIWWGLDGKFNTADDLATSVREESGYFYWKQAEGVWRMISGLFNPNYTTTTTAPDTSSTATTTTAPAVYKYKAVENQKNLFEVLAADGASKSPKEYIYSTTAPEEGKAPPAGARAAQPKGTLFYVPLVEDSGIFLAVNSDGTLNYTNAIWWGPDGIFGTADDFETSVMEEGGYYFWMQANGLWRRIESILAPTTSAPTTEAPTTTTDGFFTSGAGESPYPKTGLPLNPALMVCMALLLMGSVYCGIQVFRRRTVRAR